MQTVHVRFLTAPENYFENIHATFDSHSFFKQYMQYPCHYLPSTKIHSQLGTRTWQTNGKPMFRCSPRVHFFFVKPQRYNLGGSSIEKDNAKNLVKSQHHPYNTDVI